MAGSTVLPLQQLIASLDKNCLPRILQVCSGVYFQGNNFILCMRAGHCKKSAYCKLLYIFCVCMFSLPTLQFKGQYNFTSIHPDVKLVSL